MVAALEWWSGTECTLYTDPKSYPLYGNENAIVVLNHSYEIDFLCGWTFCERFGVLGVREIVPAKQSAHFPLFELRSFSSWIFLYKQFSILTFFQSSKVLAKKELAYVPVIGWMWYFLEIVFCKRNWEQDRRTVAQGLQNLQDYPEHFWVNLTIL